VCVGSSGSGSAVLGLRDLRHTNRCSMGTGEETTDQTTADMKDDSQFV